MSNSFPLRTGTFHCARSWAALAGVFALALASCTPGATGTGGGEAASGSSPDALGLVSGAPGYRGGVVATAEREPAQIAALVLERGGNAIDAAAAAQFMLQVVEPQSSGIGGGGIMLVHLADERRTVVVDSRETAPAAATPGMFLGADGEPVALDLASTSGRAVGVPGTLAGIDVALRRWGSMTLAEVLQPAIAAAESGIVVDTRLAEASRDGRLQNECAAAGRSPYAAARTVFRPGGTAATCGAPLVEGTVLRQPDLARTLRLIALRGPAAFYDCADRSGLARAVVRAQAERRTGDPGGAGRMTCDDLAAYRPVLREPLVARYRGWTVMSAPPPSSGGLALAQMLKVLEPFPLGSAADGFGADSARTLGLMQEAMRLAFADRAMWVGDADHVPVPVRGLVADGYLARRAASCPDADPTDAFYCVAAGRRLPGVRAGDPRPWDAPASARSPLAAVDLAAAEEGEDTTHFTVVDRWGNVVSATATVEATWGTGLMVPGFGFVLNNQLTDFNLRPRRRGAPEDPDYDPGANDPAPRKRPRSSMSPTIVFADGPAGERPVAAYGSPGGSAIINTVLAITLDLVDHRLGLQAAIDRPRLSLTSSADDAVTRIEPGFPPQTIAALAAMGYRIPAPAADTTIGGVQAVVLDPATGLAQGGADRRRSGSAVGLAPEPLAADRKDRR